MDGNATESIALRIACVEEGAGSISFEPEGAVHSLNKGEHLVAVYSGTQIDQISIVCWKKGIGVSRPQGASVEVWNDKGERLPT
jgi:hypothetical protein